ncbi:MAG: hypothetical protein PUB09_06775 [Firmicutes bacterium]|nr:hypothetical protein [Bacillota bacterium]
MSEDKKAKLKKRRIRKTLLAVLFLVLTFGMFTYLNHVFSIGESDSNKQIFNAFYDEEKDTIDAIYLGTSAANRYFINPLAYEEEGMSVFTVATMGMPMFYMPELMDEVQKTQDPDLYIIEMRWLLKDRDMITDAHIRRVTDSLKLSSNKKKIIDKTFDYMDGSKGMLGDISDNKLDYYVPIIKYHSKLSQGEMAKADFIPWNVNNKTKGYVMSASTVKRVNQFPARLSDEKAPLSDIAQRALNEVLDYCDNNGKDVLFVLSPYSVQKGQMPKFNTAIEIVSERGYPVVNFNSEEMYEELGINWDEDFYNSKHVNYCGAEKYTKWLTAYLAEHYDLTDHRGDAKYESWEESYKTYKAYVKDGIQVLGHKDKPGGEVKVIYNNLAEDDDEEE